MQNDGGNMKPATPEYPSLADAVKSALFGVPVRREITELSDDFGPWVLQFFKKHRRLPNLREAYEGGKRAAGQEWEA
jgi:hypothetical protein